MLTVKECNERRKEFDQADSLAPIVLATPDPHVERWLLLDGAAFRQVFGRGCDAPNLRCDRDLYKQRLVAAILAAGITPTLGVDRVRRRYHPEPRYRPRGEG